jgi:hypothetical protein
MLLNLAAGFTVVVKPSLECSRWAHVLGRILLDSSIVRCLITWIMATKVRGSIVASPDMVASTEKKLAR